MNVSREVVMDLLPVYLAGDASLDTRALVESFLKQDQELAQSIRGRWVENMAKAMPSSLPPELELRAFRRTRGLLNLQRWLMGFGMFFTALPASFTTSNGQTGFHFLLHDYPAVFAVCGLLGLGCWIAYFAIRRSLRTSL